MRSFAAALPVVAAAWISASLAPACETVTPSTEQAGFVLPGQGVAATIRAESCLVSSSAGWETSLSVVGLGRPDAFAGRDLADSRLPGRLHRRGERVLVEHEGWRIGYEATPRGLEQGFVVDARPEGDGPVHVRLDVTGLSARLDDDRVILFRDAQHVLSYGELFTFDSRGVTLPSHFAVAEGHISVVVDDRDAVYPITIDPLLWTPHQKLATSDADDGDELGRSIAVEGDTAVVGASGVDSAMFSRTGAAYVYTRNDGLWTEVQKITASMQSGGNRFGTDVAVSGDTIAVGASFEFEGGPSRGGAYVFTFDGTTWTEEQRIVAPEPTFNDRFGNSVALDGDTLVVGARDDTHLGVRSGSVFVYTRSGTTWALQQHLTATDRASGDQFGSSVAVEGDTALIGARAADHGGQGNAGAAYVFTRSGDVWTEQDKLVEPVPGVSVFFGEDAALEGDTVVVGAARSGGAEQGAVHVFSRTGNSWSHDQHIVASDTTNFSRFGSTVDIDGSRIVAGAPFDDNRIDVEAGAVYVLQYDGMSWTEETKLLAADGGENDQLGSAVAIDGQAIFAGTPMHDTIAGSEAGAAYVWTLTGGACGANADCANGICVDGVCCQTACDACGRCDAAGLEGECTPLPAFSVGEPACEPFLCDGLQPSCPATCTSDAECVDAGFCLIPDGLDTGICALFAPDGVSCEVDAQCESGRCVDGTCCGICDAPCAGCDGDVCGPASAGTPGACVNLVCDGESILCPEACTSDDTCPADLRCDVPSGVCTATGTCDGNHTITSADGATTDCTPYRCGSGVACLSPCGSTADCVVGMVCTPEGTCVSREAPVVVGGCSMGPLRKRSRWGWSLLALMSLLRRRRR